MLLCISKLKMSLFEIRCNAIKGGCNFFISLNREWSDYRRLICWQLYGSL
jgi:hypothetical protein